MDGVPLPSSTLSSSRYVGVPAEASSASAAGRKPWTNVRNVRKRHHASGSDHYGPPSAGIDQPPPFSRLRTCPPSSRPHGRRPSDHAVDSHGMSSGSYGFFQNAYSPRTYASTAQEPSFRGPSAQMNRRMSDYIDGRCPCIHCFPELCCLNGLSSSHCQLHRLPQGALPLFTSYPPMSWIPFAQNFSSSSSPGVAAAATVYPSTSSTVHVHQQQVPSASQMSPYSFRCVHCAHRHPSSDVGSPHYATVQPHISITQHLVPQPSSPLSFVPLTLERVSDVFVPLLSIFRDGSDQADDGADAFFQLSERVAHIAHHRQKGLTKEEFEGLDSFRFTSAGSNKSNDQQRCVVCLCDFENRQLLRSLPCCHVFHSKCIYKWLKSNKTCPICREDATVSSKDKQSSTFAGVAA